MSFENVIEFIIHSIVYKGEKIKTKTKEQDRIFNSDINIFERKIKMPRGLHQKNMTWKFC